ncbi:MAG: hypothetical protein LBJ31_01905 [Treponema sp.]|nr:hypothetical protein [Treponema sp.]
MISDFINDIIVSLEAVNDGTHSGNKEWTIAIKKKLIDIAEKYSLSVNCNIYGEEYKHNEGVEWLYDLIIYSSNKGYFDEVYLVCESEWSFNFDDIRYDFQKLLFARSKVHMLVYQVSQENYDEYKDGFINEIEKSGSCLSGDVYLFAIYNISNDAFVIEKYIKK